MQRYRFHKEIQAREAGETADGECDSEMLWQTVKQQINRIMFLFQQIIQNSVDAK